jgi:hypothetical protein
MTTQSEKHTTGIAGEYLVAGMLNFLGHEATLTLKNHPSVDIFIRVPNTDEHKAIQVKTSRQQTIQVGISHDKLHNIENKIKCLFVFVRFGKKNEIEYFIVPRKELIKIIKEKDEGYFSGTSLKKPRKKEIKDTYPIAISFDDIKSFKDDWDNIWK